MDFKRTLNLPDPEFSIPMKANLPSMEPQLLTRWSEEAIYHRIQAARKDAPTFVLHDGPPYTNSPVHLGTALNKVLKDFVVKSRTMMGFRCPYIPGFDNHGLPIEQAVQKKLAEKKIKPELPELLKACREHAQNFIDVQTEQFQRLGIFGLWERPYNTMDFRYEAELVRIFGRLVEKGLVYKGLRATMWSPTSQTALADTEIVYHEHVSKAIYVKFALEHDPGGVFEDFRPLSTVIWTTTPWTIPANLACAFHPELEYAIVEVKGERFLILGALVEKLSAELGWEDPKVIGTILGADIEGAQFKHPLLDRVSVAVLANYVTTEDGTGVVHTAPSHGRDDFLTGQKYGLPTPNTVDERGVLTTETGEFAGTYFKNCDTVVVDRLKEEGALLRVSDYHHQYPYAERDGQPIIFRATEQWFLAINPIREKMLDLIKPKPQGDVHFDRNEDGIVSISELREALESDFDSVGVTWIPEQGHNRIDAMVRNRPDWCISRQRPWGVGIPIIYGQQTRTPIFDPEIFERIAQLVEANGCEAWFAAEIHDILPEGYVHPTTGETEFSKETDILDVWFDSGATSLVVLQSKLYPEWDATWPADLYLEGSDQHRGWFNTSLILGVALNDTPPYKEVLTHGFVTDEKGFKMSKRLGNIIEPIDISNRFGADILRFWVSSVDYSNDAPCGEKLLQQFGEQYRTVRNTLRFLLSNLYDYDVDQSAPLQDLDEWLCEQVDLLVADCVEQYRTYNFSGVITAVHNFCSKELSKFYLDATKDHMYCAPAQSEIRRSSQRACHYALIQLTKLVAPILTFTAEETWTKSPGVTDSVHVQYFNPPSVERLSEIEENDLQQRFATLLVVRNRAFSAFEPWKAEVGVKNSQDVTVEIRCSQEEQTLLGTFKPEELANFFKMSWVSFGTPADGEEPEFNFALSTFQECQRCRLRRPDVRAYTFEGESVTLTERDANALGLIA